MVGSFLSHCDVFVKTPDVPSFQSSPDLLFLFLGFPFFVRFKIVLDFWCAFGLCSTDFKGSAWPPLAKKKTFTLGKIWAVQNLWRSAGEILKLLSS